MIYLQGLMVMSEKTNGLVDIIEPLAPALTAGLDGLAVSASIALLLILAGAVFYLWKYKLPSYLALKNLRKLHKQLLAGEITPHESALMLALNLRHNLAVRRLRADAMPSQISQQEHVRWVEFLQLLDATLYQKSSELNADALKDLFTQTQYWLNRYSRKSKLKKLET